MSQCGCRDCKRGVPIETVERHAFNHAEFDVFMDARAVVMAFEPLPDETLAHMLESEWHAAPLSSICDWPEHVGMPKHPRSHE